MNALQRQFVEVAARTIHEWGADNDPIPDYWLKDPDTLLLIRKQPPPDSDSRDMAVYLLGRLEGVNGTTIEEIVLAARMLWDERRRGQYTNDVCQLQSRPLVIPRLTIEGDST